MTLGHMGRRSVLAGLAASACRARTASAGLYGYDPSVDPDPVPEPSGWTSPPVDDQPVVRPSVASAPPIPSDDVIREILAERIDIQKKGIGVVVGIVEPEFDGEFYSPRKRVVAYGTMGRSDPRPVDGGTLFEIGSISKVFTSLLLADMAARKELILGLPVELLLPTWVRVPRRGGKSITLQQLASHRSGLPRMPGNFGPSNERNPYAAYTGDHAYKFLSSHKLEWDIDSRYLYSNFGAALLGHALALRAGTNYGRLLTTRVLAHLALGSTFISVPRPLLHTLASGHDEQLRPVDHWDFDFFAPAGGLRSNAEDLLLLLAHHLGYFQSSLTPAMRGMLANMWPTTNPIVSTGLGWHTVVRAASAASVTHDGITGGFYAFVAYQPDTYRAVVLLSNAANRMDDIGWHVLDTRHRLMS